MILYFMRHGEAGFSAARDFDRELTDEGRIMASNAGAFFFRKHLHLTHVLCSPILRARQTAEEFLRHLPSVAVEETEHLTPDSDPRNLLTLLRSFSIDSRLLLVTHEPFVSTCISDIISGGEQSSIIMRPGTVACIDTNGIPARGNGRLHWLLPPSVLHP